MNYFKKFLELRIAYAERAINLGESICIDGDTYYLEKGYYLDYQTGYIRYIHKNNIDGLDFWFFYDSKNKLKPLHINILELGSPTEGDEVASTYGIISDYNNSTPGHEEPLPKIMSGYSYEAELKNILDNYNISFSK